MDIKCFIDKVDFYVEKKEVHGHPNIPLLFFILHTIDGNNLVLNMKKKELVQMRKIIDTHFNNKKL